MSHFKNLLCFVVNEIRVYEISTQLLQFSSSLHEDHQVCDTMTQRAGLRDDFTSSRTGELCSPVQSNSSVLCLVHDVQQNSSLAVIKAGVSFKRQEGLIKSKL